MHGSVVANSSVLIHLSRIGRLDVLRKIFGEIQVPEAVYRECVVEGQNRPGAREIASAEWIRVEKLSDITLKKAFMLSLDEGEAEVVALAIERRAVDRGQASLRFSRQCCAKRLARFVVGKMWEKFKGSFAGSIGHS